MMTLTACPTSEQLRAMSLGALSAEDTDELLAHLQDCQDCQSEMDTIEDAEDSLIANLRDGEPRSEFDDEPDCKLALAKALGVLAQTGDPSFDVSLPMLPKLIGEYEIVRPLGQGGMGRVFLARHTKLGREVALKILASHRLADVRMRHRFEAEMRAVGKLSHPNIVTAHDARDVDGTAVLVTEFIDGWDLGQLLKRTGPLSVGDGCEIARLVAIALQYTSSQGFVHRDVKPSNVMLSSTGEVKLLDLGLARLQFDDGDQVDVTATGQAMGTADYVAPEQVTDSRSVDIRADIYSLGCTLFKLLTGQAPFADPEYATAFAKMTAHVSRIPPSLKDRCPAAPTELAKLVDSMLAKDPAKRPQTAEDVAWELGSFTAGTDLKQLAESAVSIEPPTDVESTSISRQAATNKPNTKTKSVLFRPVPLFAAIATGLIGTAIGIYLGIIITIKHPDGTETVMKTSEGSQVVVSETLEVNDAGLKQPTDKDASSNWQEWLKSLRTLHNNPGAFDPAGVRLEGIWNISSRVNGGSAQLLKNEYLVFDENGTYHILTDHRNGIFETGSYSCSLTAFPFITGLDLLDKNGEVKRKGIFQCDSAVDMTMCVDESGMTRPVTFDSNDRLVMRLHRVADLPKSASEVQRMLADPELKNLVLALSLPHEFDAQKELLRARVKQSENHLKRIALAFVNHESAYGKFPGTSNSKTASRKVAAGTKVYPFSWRVAILPFIERQDLYEQYRFDEPWNSEHNSNLLDQMPEIYRSPHAEHSCPEAAKSCTNYFGFVGETTALGTGGGLRIRDFLDGTSKTLLIVESSKSIPWTKPEDIEFNEQISIAFSGVPLMIALADGSIRAIDESNIELLKKLITRNGREVIDRTELDSKRSTRQLPKESARKQIIDRNEAANAQDGVWKVTEFKVDGIRTTSSTVHLVITGNGTFGYVLDRDVNSQHARVDQMVIRPTLFSDVFEIDLTSPNNAQGIMQIDSPQEMTICVDYTGETRPKTIDEKPGILLLKLSRIGDFSADPDQLLADPEIRSVLLAIAAEMKAAKNAAKTGGESESKKENATPPQPKTAADPTDRLNGVWEWTHPGDGKRRVVLFENTTIISVDDITATLGIFSVVGQQTSLVRMVNLELVEVGSNEKQRWDVSFLPDGQVLVLMQNEKTNLGVPLRRISDVPKDATPIDDPLVQRAVDRLRQRSL